jgi:hypothetical protein
MGLLARKTQSHAWLICGKILRSPEAVRHIGKMLVGTAGKDGEL